MGYDDPDMAARKTQYALGLGLGGVMVWDVGSEDVRWVWLESAVKMRLVKFGEDSVNAWRRCVLMEGSSREVKPEYSQKLLFVSALLSEIETDVTPYKIS